MLNQSEYQKERVKLTKLFESIEPEKAELVAGLIDDAAFLKAENTALKLLMAETGMIKIHPTNKDMQKPLETSKQYLRNVNSYAVIIKTLNSVLAKNAIEEDDPFDDFVREHQERSGKV
jgi:hypothetical protein